LGSGGLRKRYLGDVTSGREVTDVTAPLTPLEQSSLLNSDRFSTDMASAAFDGDPQFKKGAD
jgi:conjugal transfer mating pair stabilization protein TraG